MAPGGLLSVRYLNFIAPYTSTVIYVEEGI